MLFELGNFAADKVTFGHETLGVSAGFDVVRPRRQLLIGERRFYDDGHDVGILMVVTFMVIESALGRGLTAARRAHEVTSYFAAASFEMFFHVVYAVRDVPAVLKMTPDESVLVQHDGP